jgi:hypothetical protein
MNKIRVNNRSTGLPSGGQDLLDLHTRGRRRLRLVECLLYFCNHTCENSLDRVYGLIGIVKEEERLTIDYDKTSLDVFLDCLNTIDSHSYGRYPHVVTIKGGNMLCVPWQRAWV